MSNGYDQGTRRHALNLTTAGIGTIQRGRHPTDSATALVEAASIVERYLQTGLVEPHPFKVGDRTQALVFEPAGLQNLSNLQAVLDAVEAALVAVEAAAAAAHRRAVGPYVLSVPQLGTAEVLVDVVRERERQTTLYPAAHDDAHDRGEIAVEAAYAVLPHQLRSAIPADGWGSRGWFKRNTGRRGELVTGIALAVAEVERLDRVPQPAVAANREPEPAMHAEAAPTEDAKVSADRRVKEGDGPARTLTTRDIPLIVREAVLTVAAQLENQGQRQSHGRDALG